jgi:Tol biopolymer transport system component
VGLRSNWPGLLEYLQASTTAWTPGQRRRLLAETTSEAWDSYASCEHDQGREPVMEEDICAMNADGHDVRRITTTRGEGRGSWVPAWSPGGSQLAFTLIPAQTGSDFGEVEICVIGRDGSNLRNLTANDTYDGHANWW